MLNKIKTQIRALFYKSALEKDLEAELRFHLERAIEENITRGMGKDEARYAALRSFGGVERVKEENGRDFTPDDRKSSPRVAIVNESLARQFGPGNTAIGKQVQYGNEWAVIVGIVENGKHRIANELPSPRVYWSYLQCLEVNPNLTLVVRHHGNTANMVSAVRSEVQKLDPNLPLIMPMSLLETVKLITLPLRVISMLAKAFGLVGLILAAIGIYGLIAYMVNQRTYEIGVRIALGANHSDIYKIVLGHSLKLALIGCIAGIVLSLSLTWSLSSILFGISSSDPMTYLNIILLLVVVAIAASFFPARRAAKINSISSLRNE